LLKGAAYLREAGKFLSASQYHKHSNYLISNSRLPGFTEPERLMMGLIARFQRKGLPSESSSECEDLSAADVKKLRFLAGIVRLAGALDRARQNRVHDVEITLTDSQATFTIVHDKRQVPDVEWHKAGLEQESLEKSFGLKIRFELKPVSKLV
jgi:exopolyphosphatase/guanosine-5'-triphosphate,3'-diphosphate pyrophosphatase